MCLSLLFGALVIVLPGGHCTVYSSDVYRVFSGDSFRNGEMSVAVDCDREHNPSRCDWYAEADLDPISPTFGNVISGAIGALAGKVF